MRIIVGVILFAWALHAQAQRLMLDLPAQALGSALERLAEQSGVQLLYPSSAIEDRSSPPLVGEYTLDAALQTLLAGTGLQFRRGAGDTVIIEYAAHEGRVIGAVRVAGQHVGPPRGINGSTDALATEGSGRYAPRGASVASPFPQALKDTPRSLSVIGLPQLRDQNIVELADALRQLPAVAAEGYRTESVSVSVRGRPLEFYQLDGGPVRPFLGERSFGDLSAYDRVELLNGADGLDNGFTSPAGTLNLVRKRPLDHMQAIAEAQGGSWNYRRGMLDVSGAPAWDGRLRGRAVLSGVDRDYFYDDGYLRRESYYGVVEADLLPGTLLRTGGHYLEQRATPWENGGLPRYADGEPVPLPRHASLVPEWNREDVRQSNVFAAVEQALGTRWRARLSAEYHSETRRAWVTELFGAVDRETGDGLLAYSVLSTEDNAYRLADLQASGRFALWGREQIVSLGLSYADHDLRATFPSAEALFPAIVPVNLYDYDPHTFEQPVYSAEDLEEIVNQRNRRYGGRLAFTLRVLDPLSLTAAWRWSAWSTNMRVDPQTGLRELPQHRRTVEHGLSYVAAIWALDSRWNLYASWADTFILNDELLTPEGDNPAPTVGDNVEAGVKYASDTAALQARLTLYRSVRSNFPRYIPPAEGEDELITAFCCYDNAGDDRDRIQGVEAELVGAPWPRWQLSAAYTYADLQYRYADPPVDLSGINDQRGASFDRFTPRHALRLWALWTPTRAGGVRFGAGLRAQSRAIVRLFENPEVPTFPGGPQYQEAYTVADAMAGWQFHPQWDVALNVRNLFDERYYQAVRQGQTGLFWGEPRSLTLSLRGSFR